MIKDILQDKLSRLTDDEIMTWIHCNMKYNAGEGLVQSVKRDWRETLYKLIHKN